MEDHSDRALRKARKLRTEMSLPEVLLWRILRRKPMGIKFRRQHPVGEYVADFYCAQARTIIEIDGLAHAMGDRPERDRRRDAWLHSEGFKIVRIPASEVLADVSRAAEMLVGSCASSPPPSAAEAAATSPNGGGFSK